MEEFVQIVDPVAGSLALSALLAALPLILLFVLLGVFRLKAAYAAIASLVLSILLAIAVWQMPWEQALSATGAGLFYGFFPILWILINALWVYQLTTKTKWFDILGQTIRSISDDLRVLAILIAFCFGALLEGLAGFGAPVAITAAMLIAAGMKPIRSAIVALLANTAPVAFGAMGAPVIALAGVSGQDLDQLSAMVGRQTPLIALIVPFVLVILVDGWRGVKQTWPVALVSGVVFAGTQYLTSNFVTVELTDVISSLSTLIVVLLMLRVWHPKDVLTESSEVGEKIKVATVPAKDLVAAKAAAGSAAHPVEGGPGVEDELGAGERIPEVSSKRPPVNQILMAMAPYLIIIAIFSLVQIPAVKEWLADNGSISFTWPGLNVITPEGELHASQNFRFDHLKAAGTLLLISGVLTALLYKINVKTAIKTYGETLKQLSWTIITVSSVLGLAYVMNLSGQTLSLGMALAATGGFFAVLSPVIGWIGVALTGSDTSSNSLFGALQVTAAEQTGLDPVLMAATNSSAGVMGKMLSVQNLAVAAAAVGKPGAESTLLRKLFGWSLLLLAILTVLVVLQAGPLSWMVP